VGSGKTTCAAEPRPAIRPVSFLSPPTTYSKLLKEREFPLSGKALQRFGDRLDKATEGRWVLEALQSNWSGRPEDVDVVVDAARIQAQIDAIRKAFGQSVVHIHLKAPDEELS